MNTKFRLITLLAMVSVLLLAACSSSASPTAAPVTPEITAAPQGTEAAYPPAEQGVSGEQPYPAPLFAEPTQNPYPVPGEAEAVEWTQAVTTIMNGEVASVVQMQDLQVTLNLKDGRILSTTEPAIDEVFKVIDQCGDKCKDIVKATQ